MTIVLNGVAVAKAQGVVKGIGVSAGADLGRRDVGKGESAGVGGKVGTGEGVGDELPDFGADKIVGAIVVGGATKDAR